MPPLSQIIAKDSKGFSSVARHTVIRTRSLPALTFTLTDWHACPGVVPVPRACDVYVYESDDQDRETIAKHFVGDNARREALEWIETQLPF